MRITDFNPYHEIFQRYDDLAEMFAFRHGVKSQGIVFVLFEQLVALRRLQAQDPDSFVLRAWISSVGRRLNLRYQEDVVAPALDHPTAVVATDPVVIEYSREIFQREYASAVDSIQRETVEIDGPVLPPSVQSGRPHMYVIDENGRFLVWARSFRLEELVFGRTKSTVDGIVVGHPMLVPQRLRASAAGEVVFVGAPRVTAVVINNKSGHFRFPPSCREVILASCRRNLGLPDDAIDVLIVGGFHEGLVRRSVVLGDGPDPMPGCRTEEATAGFASTQLRNGRR